jgi:L-threonylcarbamoyladenylate synthase
MSEVRVVLAESPGWLADAASVLARGGLVAFPTDTVYGIGAAAFDPVAIALIYRAKGRREDQPIPVLVADREGIERLAVGVPDGAFRLADAFWPGPLTLVVPKRSGLPTEVSPGPTVGLRAPNHPIALEILRAAGPLATSSANRSNRPPSTLPKEVRAELGGHLDLLVDGGPAPGGTPSTVLDCTVDPPRILRAGPLALADILSVWGKV